MWLWYLELFLFTLVAFALGAGVGLLLVSLVVRRRADDPSLGAPVTPDPAAEKAGAGA